MFFWPCWGSYSFPVVLPTGARRCFPWPPVVTGTPGAVGPGKYFAAGWRAPRGRALLTLLMQVDWSAVAPDMEWGLGLPTGGPSLLGFPYPGPLATGNGLIFLCMCVYTHVLLADLCLQASLVPSVGYMGDKKKTLENTPSVICPVPRFLPSPLPSS